MGAEQVLVVHRNSGNEAVLEVEQSPSPPPMSSCGRYILHRVCRFDTLAGVAIKYGVEVADVKRVNGLTSDLQMFAHKTLRIPLPGRWRRRDTPPASTTREWTAHRPPRDYGLPPAPKGKLTNQTTEMATYTKGHHRKARSLSTGFSTVDGDHHTRTSRVLDDYEKPIRRRAKAAGNELPAAKEEMNNGSQQDPVAAGMLSYMDGLQSVRKSSSAPEFQDADDSSVPMASVWLRSMWSLKPDAFTLPLPLFDGMPITKPLLDTIPRTFFDGISNPIVAWRNKAAKDQ